MILEGKRGLVLNVINSKSIGWGICEALVRHGAEVGVGAQNVELQDRVLKLIDGQPHYKPFVVDFASDEDLRSLRDAVEKQFGKIDFLVHSAAFAPKEDLHGRFMDTSREGFMTAMNISCYSLIAVCKALEDLFNEDASVMTLSYLGSVRAAKNYNVMGVAKAALESTVRYLSVDLGGRGIRVNALSPGPINTVAARGVKDLSTMIKLVEDVSPLKRSFGPDEVGGSAVYLASELSHGVTGQIIYIDSGYNIMAL